MTNKLFILILVSVCFVIYFGYLGNGFVFDDRVLVEHNPLIKSAHLLPNIFKTDIYEYWTGPQAFDRMYRPLQMFSYFLDYNLWGLNPFGFRLSNLMLHLLNSILVFYLIFLVFNNKLLAQASSILFLVHPVQVSTVAYISARGDLLGGFFILSCCILFFKFLDSKNYWLYFLSIFAAFLAFLSRENALLMILFLSLIAIAVPQKKKKFRYLFGFCFLYVIYFAIRRIALGPSALTMHPAHLTGVFALVNFCNIIVHYLFLLLWPIDLRMFHAISLVNKLTFPFFSLVAVAFLLFLLALKLWSKKKWFWFSLSWFFLGIIPVYFYFDAYPAIGKALMAESWLYLPSMGFFTAFAYICLLYQQGRRIIFACVLILSSLVIANRAYWQNDIAFYQRTAYFFPEDSFIQNKLATAYMEEGNFILARQTIQKLEKYYSDSVITNSLWGQYYLAAKKPDKALSYFNRILVKSFFTNYSVSLCYSMLGDFNKAIEFSRVSFNQNAFYVPNIFQLATLYDKAGQPEQTVRYLALAKKLDPKNKQLLLK